MFNGRCVRLAAVRLRAAIAPGDAAGFGGGARGYSIYAAGRPGDRARAEDSRLQTSGTRPGYRRSQPEVGLQDGFARVRLGRTNPGGSRVENDSSAYQQSKE